MSGLAALMYEHANPGRIEAFLKQRFYVEVGYVSAFQKIQLACFDPEGTCRLIVLYQWSERLDGWYYQPERGTAYREPERED